MKVIPLFQCKQTKQHKPKQTNKPTFEEHLFRAMANEKGKEDTYGTNKENL